MVPQYTFIEILGQIFNGPEGVFKIIHGVWFNGLINYQLASEQALDRAQLTAVKICSKEGSDTAL